ncbi:hypothetical protein CACET_c35570 [Clostridium aceticum]|uniref:Uncharacterized protein n=1 Tax=Clostridium aceticum TaxID=84022 RepID=A0A0D8I5V9_9CLOT|nr:hypothetical protein [Clostridium aceticum]AKL96988.1 hypothetical protein CACET_c35570 [Clostridium aceticum]KJF25633.1 hypothetical protein TZ02_17580 [Clostridium aceticum]
MKWQEVRELYPNQFVLLKVLNYYMEDDIRYIDDVAVVKPINDPKEVTKLLVNGKSDDLVYHTKNEKIIIKVKNIRGFRGLA